MSEKYKVRTQAGVYFVTFTVVRWIDAYTRDAYRGIFVDSLNYCIKHKGLVVHAWVLMTNHAHLLIQTRGEPIEHIVRDFKRHTSKRTVACIHDNVQESRDWMEYLFARAGEYNSMNKDYQFWRNGYHPVHCWNELMLRQRLNYIHQNPVRAGFVEHAEDWKYGSARHYATGNGLVNIEPLIL